MVRLTRPIAYSLPQVATFTSVYNIATLTVYNNKKNFWEAYP
jgi:hypothetical protein